MAIADGSVVGVGFAEAAAPAATIPRAHCYDDLVQLLGDVKVWARHRGMDDLAIAMDEAIKLARAGWTDVHEALLHLSFANGYATGGSAQEAARSIGHAARRLKRWNGRRMTVSAPTIDVGSHGAEVRHG